MLNQDVLLEALDSIKLLLATNLSKVDLAKSTSANDHLKIKVFELNNFLWQYSLPPIDKISFFELHEVTFIKFANLAAAIFQIYDSISKIVNIKSILV